jgi:RNA recognition motif-containing protein
MQGNKLYVGNLKYSVSNDELREMFSNYGDVVNVNVIEGKGFGFVEMGNAEQAGKAMEALNGQDFQGRAIKVNEAQPPRKDNERRGGSKRF